MNQFWPSKQSPKPNLDQNCLEAQGTSPVDYIPGPPKGPLVRVLGGLGYLEYL